MKIRVFIIDDHPVVRKGIRGLLDESSDMEVVGESDGGPDVLEQCAALQPDIVLLDIKLGTVDGLALMHHWRQSNPDLRIVMLTSYDDELFLLDALRFGVHGYLLKSSSPEILLDTLRDVMAGERRISSSLMTVALRSIEQSESERVLAAGLTEDELDFLKLLATGATNRDIAAQLYLSERTAKRKLQELMEKLGATTRAQAVSEGYKRGLLS